MIEGSDQVRAGEPLTPAAVPERNPYDISWKWYFYFVATIVIGLPVLGLILKGLFIVWLFFNFPGDR